MSLRSKLAVAVTALMIGSSFGAAAAFSPVDAAAKPGWTKNCTAMNKKYAHGVGRANARDKTSSRPVTNFRRDTKLYNTAMRYNRGLDRDKDGIACEKR